MRIILNHLTRMRNRHVCVGGIGPNRMHKRPVLDSGQLPRSLLASGGGPFALGSVVDLAGPRPRPTPPEVEDVVFSPTGTRVVGRISAAEFEDELESVVVDSLRTAFGEDMEKLSSTAAAVPLNGGSASLGVIRLENARVTAGVSFGKHDIRLHFTDPALGSMSIKVNDLRLWQEDQLTPSARNVAGLDDQLEGCLVAVGLTRAHSVSSYPGTWHWLQINNIYPAGDPLWARE